MALYKCQSMGLLPTSPSDWIEFVEHKEVKLASINVCFNLFVLICLFQFDALLLYRDWSFLVEEWL